MPIVFILVYISPSFCLHFFHLKYNIGTQNQVQVQKKQENTKK
jgi:hypothetical protein